VRLLISLYTSSLEQEEPQEPQQETPQLVAARIIQRAWRRYLCRQVFKCFKVLISQCNQQDPQTVLRAVNPREAELLDAAAGVFIRFRLGGITFPPQIYYKIFTYRPIADLCASSPRDYTKLGCKKRVVLQADGGWPLNEEDRSGWYQRVENNTWRLFCSKSVCIDKSTEIGANKTMDFHYSKLQRRKDVEKWRKRRKVKWLKKMYKQGRLDDHSQHSVKNSAPDAMKAAEEISDDEILNWEVDELLAWTNTLNFDDYIEEWSQLACSHSSELSNAVPSCPLWVNPHKLPDE
uniref:Uncharacterized protein n=1 Tax=Stegastes partitus TaxID=144197 RepID=A0A3B5BEE4_9TELE